MMNTYFIKRYKTRTAIYRIIEDSYYNKHLSQLVGEQYNFFYSHIPSRGPDRADFRILDSDIITILDDVKFITEPQK